MDQLGKVILSHLNTDFVQDKTHDEFRDCYFDAVEEFKLYTHQKCVSEVVGVINRNLNTSRARLDGLCLLRRLLRDCDTHIFELHCIGWAGLLLSALQSHDQLVTWQVTCRTMIELFGKAKSYPELSRELMGSVVPRVITCLLQATPERMSAAVVCLADCLQCYPRTCAPFLNKMETLVVPLLESTEEDISEGASVCYSRLAGCGGGGSQGGRHTELWGQLSGRVLGSIHATLNTLYTDLPLKVAAPEIRSHPAEAELQLRHISSSETGRCYRLQHRLSVLTRVLGHMISEEFTAVVKLPVKDILNVVCRVLAVTPKMLMTSVSKDMVTLTAVLPSLHVAALKLLTHLIECATDVLLPHTSTVNRLVTQTLAWTASVSGHAMMFGRLRKQVYDTLVTWLRELGASSAVESVCDPLLPHILNDCSPHAGVIMRQEQREEIKEPATKKRRRHRTIANDLPSHHQVEAPADNGLCLSALQVLHHLLISTGHFLSVKHHKTIHEKVVPLLFKVSQQGSQSYVAPYGSAPCRRALYHVLLSCVFVPHPSLPAPTQCALRLLTIGANDPNIEVACFCREALVICSSVIHPRAPSFYKPVTTETVVMPTETPSNDDAGKHDGPVHYMGGSGDATSHGDEPELQRSNGSVVMETCVDMSVSCDVTNVSMVSPSSSGDAASVDLTHVSDKSEDEQEESLPTEQCASVATGGDVTDVTLATVTDGEREEIGVGSERRSAADGVGEGGGMRGEINEAPSLSDEQDNSMTDMLGSFVDVQPDGSDTP